MILFLLPLIKNHQIIYQNSIIYYISFKFLINFLNPFLKNSVLSYDYDFELIYFFLTKKFTANGKILIKKKLKIYNEFIYYYKKL
jgi:hypothetical protein